MTNHTLQQFHTTAIRHKLSGTAILLWQHIYFIASTRGQYTNLCMRTLDLTDTLHITCNGLQKVRRTLVNAELLQVRIDYRQHVYYTLLIDGKTIDDDIIHNNAYRKLVDAFCAKYTGHDHHTLESALMQFLYRRKERGKTLTKAGLDALLHKLVNLAQNNIRTMIDIIQQSLNRGWFGFYPYKPCTATGGYYKPKPARIPKYDTKYEDLDYLEL